MLAGLYSLSDAATIWQRGDSALRQAIRRGKLVKDVDVKMYGKQWVVTHDAMVREYGIPQVGGNLKLGDHERIMKAAEMTKLRVAYQTENGTSPLCGNLPVTPEGLNYMLEAGTIGRELIGTYDNGIHVYGYKDKQGRYAGMDWGPEIKPE